MAVAITPLEGFPAVEPDQPTVLLEPVQLEIVRRCDWKQKPCGACGKAKTNPVHHKGGSCEFAAKLGCMNCGLAKMHYDHLGQPPSWNIFGSGDSKSWWAKKIVWGEMLIGLLEESGLPKGLEGVMVEGEVTFPRPATEKGPDQENFRAPLSKILGDALQVGGWIKSDQWKRYTFGDLAYRHEPGVSRTRLWLFPRAAIDGTLDQ
jgi:hypothetical protein